MQISIDNFDLLKRKITFTKKLLILYTLDRINTDKSMSISRITRLFITNINNFHFSKQINSNRLNKIKWINPTKKSA